MSGLQPGEQIDRFVLVRRIGQGGMAMTYIGEDTETGRTVLLKFPDPNQLGDAATFERFRRELAIAERMQHPAAPHLIKSDIGALRPYLALEFIEGENMATMLNAGPLPVAQVEGIARQLADLLAYCHSQGIIHRDLKPANLLMGPDGRLHVIDFGIATVQGMPRVTWRGFSGLAGTPEYMPPEKIRGERGTARADVYAYGITLYEMLTGQVPYKADHPMSTMYLHLEGSAEPIRTLRPEAPPYLAAVVARCMRRRAAERYADGAQILYELQNPDRVDLTWLEKPDPPMGGATAAIQQLTIHPALLAVLSAVAGLLIIGLLFLLLHKRH